MLFGVPDEITDITRSLEMVERLRFIYWKIVFGHGKCSGCTGYVLGHQKGVPGTPRQRYEPYWANGGTDQPLVGWCAPIWAGLSGERKRGGGKEIEGIGFPLPFPSPLFPSPLRR